MVRILYIAGMSYCGSTLLAMLLNAHERIVSVGELSGIVPPWDNDDYPCSCGVPIGQCEFWARVESAMHARGFDEFSRSRWGTRLEAGRSRLGRRLLVRSLWNNPLDSVRDALVARTAPGRRLERIGRLNVALAEVLCELTGKGVVADAGKDPVRGRLLARRPEVELKVVHLVRDPRRFAASMLKNESRRPERTVKLWNRNAAHCERLRRRLGAGRSIRVRYEDLCGDVAGELRRITELIGVGPHRMPVAFRECGHHVVGNHGARLGAGNEVRLDESWRERLTARQVALVRGRTRRYAARYGYVT